MTLTPGTQSFADFAQGLNFGKGSSGKSLGVKPDEKRSLVPKLATWGSMSPPQLTPPPALFGASSRETTEAGFKKFAKLGVGYVKQSVAAVRTAAESAAESAQDRVQEAQDSVNRYIYVVISVLIGAFLIFLAFLFLPVVVFSPQKFALLFTLGSLFVVNGLALLKGYTALALHFCERERIIFAIGYFGSMALTLYVTLGLRSYILTIFAAIGQLIFLVTLLVSYGIGGMRVLSYVSNMPGSVFRKVFRSGGNILPL